MSEIESQEDRLVIKPMVPFEQLPAEQHAQWLDYARHCYSNSFTALSADLKARAQEFYVEFDGNLDDFLWLKSQDPEDPPVECLEWYPIGRVPAHRAARMDSHFQVYPVPVVVEINNFSPAPFRPIEGRFWYTHLYYHEGKVLSYHAMLREISKAGGDLDKNADKLWGSQDSRRCFLAEVYVDVDFESTNNRLQGFALMSREQFGEYLARITRAQREEYQPPFKTYINEALAKKASD